ncbi:MAG: transcriptional regulator [Pseudomonadota bacterium]|nr:transcriptional regulator [Pseudomonadota bacterium]
METLIDPVVAQITTHYEALNAFVPLRPIRSEGDYAEAVAALNQLLDAGAADEGHPLAGLANTVGALISTYEVAHALPEKVAPAAVLRLLMDQHSLSQSDLPEVGTQGVISEILRGKRALNVRQIRALAARFNVPASVFV